MIAFGSIVAFGVKFTNVFSFGSIVAFSVMSTNVFSVGFTNDFSVLSVGASAVSIPDSEVDGEESIKEEGTNMEMTVAAGIVEDSNGLLTDADCIGT